MITEDYVSFEIAKLLKEKGFDGICDTAYEKITSKHSVEETAISDWGKLNQIKRPTFQMAMKWLREVHNCHICVQALITTDGLQGYCPFYTKVGGVFMWQNVLGDDYATALTYEEACEAAIKYCLENLI